MHAGGTVVAKAKVGRVVLRGRSVAGKKLAEAHTIIFVACEEYHLKKCTNVDLFLSGETETKQFLYNNFPLFSNNKFS